MKRKAISQFILGGILLVLFVLFTWSLTLIDMQPIGPNGSSVAYANINQAVHNLFGVNMTLYNITDWAGPVLINGILEASYPSSTTMLAMCVLPTAMMQFHRLIRNQKIRKTVNLLCGLFTAFMVIGWLVCGVHWFTDIFGGLLFSIAMIVLYCSVNNFILEKEVKNHNKDV